MGNPPDDSNLEEDLIQIIRQSLLDLDRDFSPASDLFAAGLDSMSIMQLLLILEERYGTTLLASEVSRANLATAQALANLIREKRQQPSRG
jgi:acyl carrier protein